MNEECANTKAKRTGTGSTKWQVICPVCGVIDTGATLAAVIDTEYAHIGDALALRTAPPAVRRVRLTRNGLRVE